MLVIGKSDKTIIADAYWNHIAEVKVDRRTFDAVVHIYSQANNRRSNRHSPDQEEASPGQDTEQRFGRRQPYRR